MPSCPDTQEALLIEAEHFDDLGGWTLDTEFMASMSSPYLIAHGLGVPVADAVTTVRIPTPGKWRVWVRTFNWVARWKAPGAPGRFQLVVNGKALTRVLGTEGSCWHWQDGGVVDIPGQQVTLALHDLTGFNGRCDAIYFTRTLEDDPPPNTTGVMPTWRRQVLYMKGEAHVGHFDLVVVGGGYAGMCAALSAARAGLKTALIQDRPVLGGNASSEIRVPLRGLIPVHGPWPGIGRIVEELQYDPNPDSRKPERKDDARCERILSEEKTLSVFLYHSLYSAHVDEGRIQCVTVLDVRTGASKTMTGRLFADCTGHGTLGALAGADTMIGTQEGDDYQPSREEPLMGLTNKWFWELADSPQDFPPTPWALDLELHEIPVGALHATWCWESGFSRHPIDALEYIRDWNLRAVFGIWNAMKHKDAGGQYANARLLHVGVIGGPRESRRLIGDYVLNEDDILRRVVFNDGFVPVSWFLDRHFPSAGCPERFSEDPFLAKAVHKPGTDRDDRPRHAAPWWGIPYRCLYSRNIANLFMAGRNISTSYWALGAVRVMRTCGMMGEVVGKAAALCARQDCLPRDVYEKHLHEMERDISTQ